jgi:glycosyltransferase involved in cell wall biosynthesis
LNSNSKKATEKAKPQIIYAWDYVEWGGAQIYYFALIKEVKKEFDVKVVLPEKSDEQLLKFIQALDVPYEFIPSHTDSKPATTIKRKLERHLNKFKSESVMIRHLKKQDLKNSIVHIEFAPWQALFSLMRLSSKTRVFITAHNSLPPVPKWRHLLWKLKLKAISHFKNFNFFSSNEDSKNYFKQFFPAEFWEKIKVTYTSVNPPEIAAALALEYNREDLKRKFNIPADKFLVLCVGQFIDRKGRWTFLEAAKKVSQTIDDITFVWISNSKPSNEDLQKAENFGLGERFRLITSDQVGKDRMDLFKMFRLADAFVLASFVEGLPISLLEAMALGIPSVSTNVNAIPEAVKNRETGMLIEAGDSDALAEAIETLKTDEKLRERLSKNGRAHVLKNFDEREVARIAIAAYKESLGVK